MTDCRRCGAPLHEGVIICPECGARQRRRATTVRCAVCHKAVPVGLRVCPHCGRDVRPAGPRWGFWLAGVVALAVFSLWALDRLPVARVIQEATAFRNRISGLVEVLGPAVGAPSLVASEPQATPALVELLLDTPTPEPTLPPTVLPPPAMPTPPVELVATSEEPAAVGVPGEEAAGAAAAAGETETPGPTAPSVPTATATPLPVPTATPTRTPSPTLPPPTATSAQSDGRTVTYRVQSGDTLSTIAAQFGITWQELAAANGLDSRSVLRIGQELVIPLPGAALPPTATPPPRPRATATPVPPTATPLPQLAAPVLKDPGDNAFYSGGDAFVELSWQPVPGMGPADQYLVVVTWDEQGTPMEHRWFTTATGTRVPPWLWGKADQPARKYTWSVQVVQVTTDGKGREQVIPLSPPSPSRVFYWG